MGKITFNHEIKNDKPIFYLIGDLDKKWPADVF
jgi:hypothetical protein